MWRHYNDCGGKLIAKIHIEAKIDERYVSFRITLYFIETLPRELEHLTSL